MIKKLKYLFLISTEHQLLQVRKAIQHFKLNTDEIVLFVFKTSKYSINEKNVELYSNVENIKVFENWTFKDLVFNRKLFKSFLQALKELQSKNSVLWVFTSQYFNDYSYLAYSILMPDKFFLLDEGTASFPVVEHRNKFFKINTKHFIKTILYGKYLSFPSRITYFTQYLLKVKHTDSLVLYKFDLTNNTPFEINHKEAIFLGSSLVELNLIDSSIYLYFLSKIKSDLGNRRCFYYAHRKENSNKLDEIKKLGFEVVLNSKPFEFLFPEFRIYPSLICSFFSPILDTLTKQYKNTPDFIIYKFDLKYLKRNKKIVKMILDSFESNPKLVFRNI